MKNLFAVALLLAGLFYAGHAYADSALGELNAAASDSSTFDGGGTLDSPEASTGDEPNQGTFHAEANS